MSNKRKAISNKLRFEIFKRDSFKCQYCGKSAPDIVLCIDHLKPVVSGGGNDILNLITSCFECNSGKGKHQLSDRDELDKARKQLEELNERRAQLEMMVQWKEGLSNIDETTVESVVRAITANTGLECTNAGRAELKKWIKRFNYQTVFDAIPAAFQKYTGENFEDCFRNIPKCCKWAIRDREQPELKELFYIRAILRNRFSLGFEQQKNALGILKILLERGYAIEELQRGAKECGSYAEFVEGYMCPGEEGE